MSTPSQFWVLRLGNQSFALEPKSLKEVVEVSHLAPVPLAPPFVLGLLAKSGQVYALVDLGELLQQPTGTPTLAAVVGQRGQSLALAIHEVLKLHVPMEDMAPYERSHPLSGEPFVAGWIPWQNQYIPVLDLDGLLTLLNARTVPELAR